MPELSGKTNGIEWSIDLRRTPNGTYHALVKVGTSSAVSEDHLTKEEAKEDGCSMMADMLDEVEGRINA
ncbi:hypothetical protein [Candidatus Villigracilis saccharophilus]|uniref:hypothetical protein n=1 Tax=Candidatus Villigracilis saccharophilus TaxID=3140684 RepID=UPI0031349A25|nr:hypothetical protein [Anaerolineales bacterium]